MIVPSEYMDEEIIFSCIIYCSKTENTDSLSPELLNNSFKIQLYETKIRK